MHMEALIIKTGKKIYSSDVNDLLNDSHCWFSSPDGNSQDCSFVMDNKEFNRRFAAGEISINGLSAGEIIVVKHKPE